MTHTTSSLIDLFESDDTATIARAYDELVADVGHAEASARWSAACDAFDEAHAAPDPDDVADGAVSIRITVDVWGPLGAGGTRERTVHCIDRDDVVHAAIVDGAGRIAFEVQEDRRSAR